MIMNEGHSARDFVRVLRRRKWIVLQAAILVPVAAYFLAARQPVHYSATAQLYVESTVATTSSFSATADIAGDVNLARLPVVARAVLAKAKITSRTPEQLLGSSSVTAVSSNIVDFQVSDSDPAIAAQLATAFARTFVATSTKLTLASFENARGQIEAKIAGLKAQGQDSGPAYAALVQRDNDLQAAEALETASPFLVNPASGAATVGPHPRRDALLGLIVGIVLGIALAYLVEAFDTRVRSESELEAHLGGLPLLARIPKPRRFGGGNGLVMAGDATAPQAEPFRVLRTNLEFVNLEVGAKMILTTSATASEGKSTTVSNLAIAMARGGRHVILVDLDLRQATLDRYFGIEASPGLTHVVLGSATLDEALVEIPLASAWKSGTLNGKWNGSSPDTMGSLEVLGAGALPPNAGEFVGTRAVADLLDELRQRADMVLIDAPPLLEVGDAATLSALVDGLLVIARMDALRRPMLRELRRRLDACPAPKLGFALHGVAATDDYYSYSGVHDDSAFHGERAHGADRARS
jgi:succinoglycan biosynthesis transport protein ExoP